MKKLFIIAFIAAASCLVSITTPTTPLLAQQAVQLVGGATLTTGQVSVGTSATLIVPGRMRNRVGLIIQAANNCAFGTIGVSLTNGHKLPPAVGASLTVESSADIYGICDVATTVSFMEVR